MSRLADGTRVRLGRGTIGIGLLFGLVIWLGLATAADKGGAKPSTARVIYSGQFRGHVEPCG